MRKTLSLSGGQGKDYLAAGAVIFASVSSSDSSGFNSIHSGSSRRRFL